MFIELVWGKRISSMTYYGIFAGATFIGVGRINQGPPKPDFTPRDRFA